MSGGQGTHRLPGTKWNPGRQPTQNATKSVKIVQGKLQNATKSVKIVQGKLCLKFSSRTRRPLLRKCLFQTVAFIVALVEKLVHRTNILSIFYHMAGSASGQDEANSV